MKKPEKSESDRQDPPLDSLYATRVARERRWCSFRAFVINTLLIDYFFWGVYDFGALSQGEFRLTSLLMFLPVAGILAFFWTRSSGSLGRMFVERTSPILKGLRVPPRRRWVRVASNTFGILVLLLTFALGWQITEMGVQSLFRVGGLEGAKKLFGELFTPNLESSWVSEVAAAMMVTVFLALMATLFAIPVAFLLSFFSARNLMKFSFTARSVYAILRVISNFARSLEPLIWAIIFSVWIGIGPFAGMLALMIHSIASLTKLYSEQIESIDRGPIEAIEAVGANRIQVVWYAVVPQVVLPYLSFTIYRWDINVRMATIIGLVGGGGIGALLIQCIGKAQWHRAGTIVLTIVIVVWLMDYLSARVREAIY